LANNEEIHNIKIKIDDSEAKKFDAEEKARLKVQTARAIEEEKRKTMAFKDGIEQKRQARKKSEKEAIDAEKKLADEQKKSIDEQIRNINRLAESEKKRIAGIESKASENLRRSALNNRIQSSLSGFTGSNVNEIRQQVSELKKFRDGLALNDPLIAKVNNRIRELNATLRIFTNTSKTSSAQLLEMGENMATIGIALKLAGMQIWAMIKPLKDFAINSITTGAELSLLRKNFRGSAQDIELFKKATANTVTESSLIKLSNQATDLGLSLEQQALFFSLAEDKADMYGGSIEDNFQKLLFATENGTRGLKNVGIETAKYNEELKRLVEEQKGSVEISQTENGEKEITIKNLDAETQKRLKVQAVLNLSGVTLDQVNNKQKDNKDLIDSLGVTYDEFSSSLGSAFGDNSREMVDNFSKSLEIVGLTSQNTGLTVGKVAGAIGQAIAAIIKYGNVLGIVINTFPKFIDGLKKIYDGVTAVNRVLGLPVPSGWKNSILSALDGVIQRIRDVIYFLGLLPSQKADEELPANPGTKDTPKKTPKQNSSSNSGNTQAEEKQLNFLETLRQKVRELQDEIKSLNEQLTQTDLLEYERLRIEEEIVKKREELNELIKETIALLETASKGRGGNARGRAPGERGEQNGRPQGDIDTEKALTELEEERLRYANQIKDEFLNMLQITGLMNTEFGRIIQMIQSIIGGFSSGFNLVSGIIGFVTSLIPGGGAISAVAGRSVSPMQGGIPNQRMPININIPIKGTMDGQKFLVENMSDYNIRVNLTNA